MYAGRKEDTMKRQSTPKIYVVLFDTQHVREHLTKHYVFHTFANNAQEARAACEKAWLDIFGENKKPPHQFHIHAARSSVTDPDLLRVITWKSAVVNGRACFDIYCADWTNWRK